MQLFQGHKLSKIQNSHILNGSLGIWITNIWRFCQIYLWDLFLTNTHCSWKNSIWTVKKLVLIALPWSFPLLDDALTATAIQITIIVTHITTAKTNNAACSLVRKHPNILLLLLPEPWSAPDPWALCNSIAMNVSLTYIMKPSLICVMVARIDENLTLPLACDMWNVWYLYGDCLGNNDIPGLCKCEGM